MKYRFFHVSVLFAEEHTEKLNQFLSSHTVVNVDKQFVNNGDNSYWAFCVDYLGAV